MLSILKNDPPSKEELNLFLDQVDFVLPIGFVDFFKESNGAEINGDESFTVLWPLNEMIQLNRDYRVDEFAPEFFIIGSDGGDVAYAIERSTGFLFEMPFIGMSKEEAVFRNKTFTDFISEM